MEKEKCPNCGHELEVSLQHPAILACSNDECGYSKLRSKSHKKGDINVFDLSDVAKLRRKQGSLK